MVAILTHYDTRLEPLTYGVVTPLPVHFHHQVISTAIGHWLGRIERPICNLLTSLRTATLTMLILDATDYVSQAVWLLCPTLRNCWQREVYNQTPHYATNYHGDE